MFNKGDKYIHFTTRGGINFGEVQHISKEKIIDVVNGVVYFKEKMSSTVGGTSYNMDGSDGRFYKLDKILSEEECESIKEKHKTIAFHLKNMRAEALLHRNEIIDFNI